MTLEPEKLLTRYFNSVLTDEEFRQLETWLRVDPKHVDLYIKSSFLNRSVGDLVRGDSIQKNIKQNNWDFDIFSDHCDDSAVLKALLNEERSAPGVEKELDEQTPKPSIEEKKPQTKNKISRFWPTTAIIASVAALLLLSTGIVSHLYSHRVVATLGSMQDAEWAEAPKNGNLHPGPIYLTNGFAELIFRNGTQVIVEGPSRIDLQSKSSLSLDEGTLVATIKDRANGFTVQTPHATVEDLGTKFGMQVQATGEAETLVFDGKVRLQGHGSNHTMPALEVSEGSQVSVSSQGDIGEIQTLNDNHRYRCSWYDVQYMPKVSVKSCRSLCAAFNLELF